jgi:D-glycero-alpha-D-manno-heptose 1-phosphate guanylyltransferase
MQAIVLAGGFGTRLRQVVSDVPKPMAPVAGRPFLEYVLDGLARNGVAQVVLSVGFMADKIMGHFGTRYASLSIDYAVEDSPLGTGGAVAAALAHCSDNPVLVLNGDTWLDLELAELQAQWQASRLPIIVSRAVDDVARYGQLDVQGGLVTGFLEKGGHGPGLINAGVYVLPRDIFGSKAPSPPFSIEADFLASYVRAHATQVFVSKGEFIDIGVPEDYARVQTMNLGGAMRTS